MFVRSPRGPALALLLLLVAPPASSADVLEQFEGPQTSWSIRDRDCPLRVVSHARVADAAREGTGSEYVHVFAGQGSYAYLGRNLEPSRLIHEMEVRLWVRSSRPGLQLAMRVVLPRSRNPETGEPFQAVLRGSMLSEAGSWEQLVLRDPLKLLEDQVRIMRWESGSPIDAREAFVTEILLNVYGGAGSTETWIDALEVTHQFPVAEHRPDGADTVRAPLTVRLQGSVLLVNGRPYFARLVTYRGEPLEWLRRLGFNTVVVENPVEPRLLEEAEAFDMWIVAPPPPDGASALPAGPARVLAWNLGEVEGASWDGAQSLAAETRRFPPAWRRPLVAGSTDQMWECSRMADILWLPIDAVRAQRPFQLTGALLRDASEARIGTPFWVVAPSEVPESIREQAHTAGAMPAEIGPLELSRLNAYAMQSVAAGARGIHFASSTPLDGPSEDQRLRALTCRQVHDTLRLIDPWIAGGQRTGELPTGTAEARVDVLQTSRSRLLVIHRNVGETPFVLPPPPADPLRFVVHGIPITDEAYLLKNDRLEPLEQERGLGIRVTIPPLDRVSLVILSQDRLAFHYVARQQRNELASRRQLAYELARATLQRTETLHERMAQHPWLPQATVWIGKAKALIRQFEMLEGGAGAEHSWELLRQAEREMSKVRYAYWEEATRQFVTPVSSPFCSTADLIPRHWELLEQVRRGPWSDNVVPGGDFESLEMLESTGWVHEQPHPAFHSLVELSGEAPHRGRSSLHLVAWPADSRQDFVAPPAPAILIQTAPIAIEGGELVLIEGWARVETDRVRGHELRVVDSLGGEPLALTLGDAPGWTPFRLYRLAPRSGTLQVRFVLHGVGEAWIDDVTIRRMGDRLPVTPDAVR